MATLRRHERNVHEEKRYVCPKPSCGKDYADPSGLRKHLVKVHPHLAAFDGEEDEIEGVVDAATDHQGAIEDVAPPDASITPRNVRARSMPRLDSEGDRGTVSQRSVLLFLPPLQDLLVPRPLEV